jgi:hypothetical protein
MEAMVGAAGGGIECWCCGSRHPDEDKVHLGNHFEVSVCVRCARSLHKWAGEVEDRDRRTPTARARDAFRSVRKIVVQHRRHRAPLVGRSLRWLARYLP